MLAEKLDYIMTLTHTKNSELAKALNFDPSYISRMRTGKRGVPNHHPFIEPAARFFAHRITEDHQKASLSEMLLSGDSWPEDPDTARLLIAAWLNDNTPAYRDTLSRLMQKLSQPELSLKTFSSPDPEVPSQGTRPAQHPAEPVHREPVSFFYGKEGKRAAFLSMMDHVLSREDPGTLLLHSEEKMDWISDNNFFSSKWIRALTHFVEKGGTIRVIHTINRNFSEMLNAIESWLPLYITGHVEPWYCPHLRDGIIHRSMFVIPDTAALISSSVGRQSEGGLHILIHDRKAIRAIEKEFQDFQELCRPLMQSRILSSPAELPGEIRSYACNFNLVSTLPRNIELYVDEEKGVAVFRNTPPYLLFTTTEPHITRSFMDYWLLYHE